MSGAAIIMSGIFDLNISCLGSLELQFLSQYWVNVGNSVTLFSFLGHFTFRKYFMGKNNQVRILESPQCAANFSIILTLQIVAARLSS